METDQAEHLSCTPQTKTHKLVSDMCRQKPQERFQACRFHLEVWGAKMKGRKHKMFWRWWINFSAKVDILGEGFRAYNAKKFIRNFKWRSCKNMGFGWGLLSGLCPDGNSISRDRHSIKSRNWDHIKALKKALRIGAVRDLRRNRRQLGHAKVGLLPAAHKPKS